MARKWLYRLASALTVTLLFVGLVYWSRQFNPEQGSFAVGRTAPNFTLTSLQGQKITLKSLRGHPVLLDFFATWCTSCAQEAQELNLLSQKYPHLRILAIDLRVSEPSTKSVQQFAKTYATKYPILLDQTGKVSTRYLVRSIPANVFILPNGQVFRVIAGAIGQRTLAQEVSLISQSK